MLRIAIAQINPTVGDLKGNQQLILDYILRAKEKNADLVVFPELAICGYPPEDLLYKNHFIQDNIKSLKKIAAQVQGISGIIGFVDCIESGVLHNAAAFISEGKIKSVYHKQKLPNYGVFDEKRYFKSSWLKGKLCGMLKIKGVSAGISICEDIWVEDGVCNRQAKAGAQLLINISSSPYDIGKLKIREAMLKQRAQQAAAHVCYVNVVGGQDELVFDGRSMIVGPKGEIVAKGKLFEEDLVLCDLPLGTRTKQDDKKAQIKNLLPKKMTKIEIVYKALVLGTQDYIKKNGFKKVVIGLSGGIDSALVTAIAVKAIGKENVICVTMPSRYTSTGTRSDAERLAKNLEVELITIPIEDIFTSYVKTLSNEFKGTQVDVTEENIQARIRGNLLMALSNKFGWLVLTTGNKSEVAVGYCTLYGDMSGGFAVIKDVPKTMVYQLSEYINKIDKQVIPITIIRRAPSAELRSNQKDQDSLPPYDVLDPILEQYVEKHESVETMSKKNKKDIVQKIIDLVDHSEYKRRQAPPGIKITSRAFGKDWRLPITNKYREF
ncbi:MAG: NAD+ synthase [Candidatus Omnitrophica bacterium]|nr:NAD+ synthase [Candidatus Omnitrophota bacterium]MBU1997496.1 NAD+ synthase [Candidatus Omnitrophota bacterium]MBU4333963.1 NAD+ synthase [Candidatus Omnitrophota bacterium]